MGKPVCNYKQRGGGFVKKNQTVRFFIEKADALTASLGRVLGILFTISIILTLSAGVVSRYIFNSPIFWTDEVARMLLIWSIFIGAALGFRKDASTSHISMDYFVSLLPPKPKKTVERFSLLLNALFGFLMLIIGTAFFIQTITFRTAALEISKGFIYVCLPVFAVMTIVFVIHNIFDR